MRPTPGLLLLLATVPLPAEADPITLRHHVTLTQRHDLATDATTVIEVNFIMSTTFDDEVTFRSTSPGGSILTFFGTPRFSGVPDLGGAGPRPGSSGTVVTTARETRSLNGRSASVASAHDASHPNTFTNTNFFLFAETPPVFPLEGATAASLRAALRTATFNYASYEFIEEGVGIWVPGSVNYSGTAVALDPAPVPEPTTFLLVGAGLLGVHLRSRRRRPNV